MIKVIFLKVNHKINLYTRIYASYIKIYIEILQFTVNNT